jgi:hypothetical protein
MDYQKPSVSDYGTLQELTAGQHEGEFTDAEFPINTPKKDLTFS